MQKNFWRFETSAVHAGYTPDTDVRAVAMPVYQTAAFAFDDTEHGANLFEQKVPGYVYTRVGNPTGQFLADRVAALEQGAGAAVTGSGQAAVAAALLAITGTGENIVAAASLYGTTYNLLAQTLPQYGI